MKSIFYYIIFAAIIPLLAGEWVNGPQMEIPRAGASSVVLNGEIYVLGGKTNGNHVLNSVEVYNPQTKTWDTTRVAPFETPRYNAAAVVQYGKIFLIGGRDNNSVLKSVELYDPVENKWEEVEDLDEEREGHSAHVLRDKIFVLGGQEEIYDLVSNIEWYNWEDDKWEESAFQMDSPRSAFFSAAWWDTVYIFGGFQYGRINSCYKSAPDSGDHTWEACGLLSEPRGYGATAVFDSLVYLFGGETADGKTTKVEVYNFFSGEIYEGVDMPMPHSGMTAAVLEDEIFVLGGFEGPENRIVRHNHVYRPLATALPGGEKPASFPQGFSMHPAYPNPFNGQVNIRIDVSGSAHFSVDVYDYSGRKAATLHDGTLGTGSHTLRWQTSDLNVATGVYFVTIQNGKTQQTQKLLYVK